MRRGRIEDRQLFSVKDGCLIRSVDVPGGVPYQHRCTLAAFRAVASYIEHHGASGVTVADLWENLPDVPCSQSAVAVAFMKERGCVDVRRRRVYPASGVLFEDAMVEFHALES